MFGGWGKENKFCCPNAESNPVYTVLLGHAVVAEHHTSRRASSLPYGSPLQPA